MKERCLLPSLDGDPEGALLDHTAALFLPACRTSTLFPTVAALLPPMSSPTFTEALFVVGRMRKPSKCTLTSGCMEKTWWIHTGEPYAALERKEVLTFATTRMSIEDKMRNKPGAERPRPRVGDPSRSGIHRLDIEWWSCRGLGGGIEVTHRHVWSFRKARGVNVAGLAHPAQWVPGCPHLVWSQPGSVAPVAQTRSPAQELHIPRSSQKRGGNAIWLHVTVSLLCMSIPQHFASCIF